MSHDAETTLFTTLLTTLYVLIFHYTDETDLIIGSPMTGRSRAAWLETIGYFVNPVVLRNSLGGNPTFADLVQKVKKKRCKAPLNTRIIPFRC